MNRRMTTLLLVILLALAAVVTDSARSTSAVAVDDGPSASGHGNLIVEGGLETFSFHARQKEDGIVEGSFQINSRGQEAKVHGEIDCLRIIGNMAVMSGTITKSDPTIFEGRRMIFRVIDNGEGANDPPDLMTDARAIPRTSTADCNSQFSSGPFYVVEEGNIQVKP